MSRFRNIASSLAVGSVALCAIGLAASVRPPSEVAPLDAVVAAVEQRRVERLRDREPAFGGGTTGSAAEHYDTALGAVKKRTSKLGIGLVEWNDTTHTLRVTDEHGWRTVSNDELAAHRSAFTPAVAALQRGARCRDASATISLPRELSIHQLTGFTQTEVALRVHEGRDLDAVELWLDLVTFRLDVVGSLYLRWSPDDVASLSPTAATALAHGVERIDRRLAQPFDVGESLPAAVENVHDRSFTQWSWREGLDAWGHGFDAGAHNLAAFAIVAAHLDVLEPVANDPEAREAQWRLFCDVIRPSCAGCRGVSIWVDQRWQHEHLQRGERAIIRSLRLGLAARLGTLCRRSSTP